MVGQFGAYDWAMSRAVVWAACAVAFAGSAAVARADPHGPPPPPPPCSFEISVAPPSDDGIAATVQSTGCAALAVPYSTVVCLQPAGGVQSCAHGHGDEPARIALPYRPGAAYTATGRGCAGWIGLPPAPDCQILGPVG